MSEASIPGSHEVGGLSNQPSEPASSATAARNADRPGWSSPLRQTISSGDSGTGRTSGRNTAPSSGGKPATASTGWPVFVMTRWNSATPTASGAAWSQHYVPLREEHGCEIRPLTRARIARPGVDGFTGQITHGDRFTPCQRMIARQEHGHRLVPHRLYGELGEDRGIESGGTPERDVQPSGEHLTRRPGQPALETGHQLAVGCELPRPGQHPGRGHPVGVQVDEQRTVRRVREGGTERGVGFEDPAGVRQETLPVRGEGDLPGGADEELPAQLALQPADVAAQRLLRHVEPGGGTGEVQLLGHGDEGAEDTGIGVGGGHRPNLQQKCVSGL